MWDERIVEAVVVPISDPEFGMRPFAICCTSDPSFNVERMKIQLLDKLPKFKIPIGLRIIDEMPLVGNKIDRKIFSYIVD